MPQSKLTLSEFLPYQLSITSNAVSDLIARSYRGRFGLKIPEWRVMAVLGERPSATQRDLVTLTQMDKVTVNRASKELVDRGLIARAPNESDGRSHHLALTDVGRELYHQIVPLALSVEAEIEEILGGEQTRVLEDMLAKLRERVAEMEKRFG
ncbi:MarR family winged helix-turn-helix transcriptional regulator [Sphingorhabdus sp.]|jgi:DNA-binding MarR family transcriptional regulator|uniref:MarR family winged helix-turn-helix transcriptional regulator n=1 Tax=Sphingorhabdus sp. TaxID=1902408 RepID=UPI003BB07AED|nr:winged helix-turn-helix transcriptional regulator [Sphingomonadales bacterium]MBL0020862.1 winged helix-turn-helix transcriptional regulator [Sphingomonadales bacterium]